MKNKGDLERGDKKRFFQRICYSVPSSKVSEYDYMMGKYPSLSEIFGVYRRDTINKRRLDVIDNGHTQMFLYDNIIDESISELDVLTHKPKDYNMIDWLEDTMKDLGINKIFSENDGGITLTELDGKKVLHYWWTEDDYNNRDKENYNPLYINRSGKDLTEFM